MTGTVNSYDSSTGALVASITEANGSGAYNNWSLSIAGGSGGGGAKTGDLVVSAAALPSPAYLPANDGVYLKSAYPALAAVMGKRVNQRFMAEPIPVPALGPNLRATGASGSLQVLIWTGSLYVAVGNSGAIVTSPDAVTWTSRASGTTNQLVDVIWTGSQFVAVGALGTILTSPDGITWTSRTSNTANSLSQVASNGTTLVAAGASGTLLTSPDGITWSVVTTGTTQSLLVAFGNGIFLVVETGSSGFGRVSSNGTTWTSITVPFTPTSLGWLPTNQIFAMGVLSSANIVTTQNGTSWSSSIAPQLGSASSFFEIENVIVAVGSNNNFTAVSYNRGATFVPKSLQPQLSSRSTYNGSQVLMPVNTLILVYNVFNYDPVTQFTLPSIPTNNIPAYYKT
jgi:hypothetical protein